MDQKNWYCKNGYTEISINIPIMFFTELEKNSSHPSETQNTPNKAILSRKSNAGDVHHPISNYTSGL